jgi:hypothetical protein
MIYSLISLGIKKFTKIKKELKCKIEKKFWNI